VYAGVQSCRWHEPGMPLEIPAKKRKDTLYDHQPSLDQATGIYRSFAGGHNHMVDRLHNLANGSFDEFCFCIISQYQFP
jgi:hypothetical protein